MKEYLETVEHVDVLMDNNKKMMDDVLDLYNKHPEICSLLMKDLIEIEKEIDELSEELDKIKDEIC